MDEPLKWITEPIEKFGDVRSAEERHLRRNLPPPKPYRQAEETSELALRREADQRFRIKRAGE